MSKIIAVLCVIFLVINMTFMPAPFIDSGIEAVDICLNTIIPSLFPFFICSGLLVELGFAKWAGKLLSPALAPVFNIPGSGAVVFVMGILSGYPVGAKCAVDLYRKGECTKEEAERMIAFCNNSGPMFILGAVGAVFLKNEYLGWCLYISHVISAVLVGVIFRFYKRKAKSDVTDIILISEEKNKNIGLIIGNVIGSSVDTILKVCGFVIIFYVFGKSISVFKNSELFYGIFEMTSGVAMLTKTQSIDPLFKLTLISFFISFSGISVLLQVSSIVIPVGLSVKPYVLGKTLQGVFSAAITYFICLKLPATVSVFASSANAFNINMNGISWLKVSLIMLLWC